MHFIQLATQTVVPKTFALLNVKHSDHNVLFISFSNVVCQDVPPTLSAHRDSIQSYMEAMQNRAKYRRETC